MNVSRSPHYTERLEHGPEALPNSQYYNSIEDMHIIIYLYENASDIFVPLRWRHAGSE